MISLFKKIEACYQKINLVYIIILYDIILYTSILLMKLNIFLNFSICLANQKKYKSNS